MEIEEIKEVYDVETEEEEINEDETSKQSEEEKEKVEESEEQTDEDAKPKENSKEKKKQTSEERKRFAEMRREKEAKERQEEIAKAKKDGIIEGLGGINPYTNEKIEDDIDYELYQEMRDAESKGYNPNDLSDMRKYRKEIRLAELKSKEEESRVQTDAQKDVDDFIKNNPDVNMKELLGNQEFLNFADGMIGKVSLEIVYKKYQQFKDTASKKAEEIALDEKARRNSSVGSLTNGDTPDEEYSLEKIASMSREEIAKNYDKIMKSYFKK